ATVALGSPVPARGAERALMPSTAVLRLPSCSPLLISKKVRQVGQVRQMSNPRAFSLSHLLAKKRDKVGHAPDVRAHCAGAFVLTLNAKPNIDPLLPFLAVEHLIAPRSVWSAATGW